MSKYAKTKPKKPLDTTLGQAAKAEELDLSHVQKPMDTSIFGLKQALSLFHTATSEVKNLITNECDVMYECKICRTIFRSLANFVLHKRRYCQEKFTPFAGFITNAQEEEEPPDSPPEVVPIFSPPDQEDPPSSDKKDLGSIIEKLVEKQKIEEIVDHAAREDLSNSPSSRPLYFSKEDKLVLEEINSNKSAMFQTMFLNNGHGNTIKDEVMEIHGILDSDEAVLGPDGKVFSFTERNKTLGDKNFVCKECNLKFSTKKTLTYHVQYKHNPTRVLFICPECKDSFANAWGVYRHLYKIHRKSNAQIKRMRDVINNNRIIRKDEPRKTEINKRETRTVEDQWLNNVEEDNDLQMCGGCGKKFERKAALHSHSQMCVKRIAVCNTIKSKKNEEEERKEKQKPLKNPSCRGSNKRKPLVLKKMKPLKLQFINQEKKKKKAKPKTSDTKEPEIIQQAKSTEPENEVEIIECNSNITEAEQKEEFFEEMEQNQLTVKSLDELTENNDIEILHKNDNSFDSVNNEEVSPVDGLKYFTRHSLKQQAKIANKIDFQLVNKDVLYEKAKFHMDQENLNCISCSIKYESFNELIKHMSKHFNWFRYQCSKCSFVSYDEIDCEKHAKEDHSTVLHELHSVVLPIPNWKSLLISSDFQPLQENAFMMDHPALELIKEEPSDFEEESTPVSEDLNLEEEIVLENKESDNLELEGKNIDSNDCDKLERTDKVRPIRNRTKSVKTFNSDFFYDLSKALRLNDSKTNKVVKCKKPVPNGVTTKKGSPKKN